MASKKNSVRPAPELKVPMAAPKMRIGLLGGSFDPAHEGHRRISLAALQRLGLDQVWWLVSPSNPLKKKPKTEDLATRVAAARKVAHHPKIVVTGFEGARRSAYTIDTIRFLKQRYPSVNFVWLMGADNLATFHLWRSWHELFELVPIAVLDRPGFRLKARSGKAAQRFASSMVDESDGAGLAGIAPPAWTLLTLPLSGLSSTALRDETPQDSGAKAKARKNRKAAKAAKKVVKQAKKETKKDVKKAAKRLKKAAKTAKPAKSVTKAAKVAKPAKKAAKKQAKKAVKRATKIAKLITKKSKKKPKRH
jgi:nicotinate-nucleotide adenylyltransferase